MDLVKSGEKVLLLWNDAGQISTLESQVRRLSDSVGADVCVENADRLLLSAHAASKFDACLSSSTPPHSFFHSDEILAEIAKVLKPNGRLTLTESTPSPRSSSDALVSALTLSGFVTPSLLTSPSSSESSPSPAVVSVECRKPGFEVGQSSALKLNLKKKKPNAAKINGFEKQSSTSKTAIWSLDASDMLDAEVELMDPDSLLDESDYVKPDPLSLKYDCGTNKAGKKKACKNCVCGLAEELDAGKPISARAPSSACGSCYLGDAFRCASCPYLGMPSFKPGEKIALTDRQLKGDV